LTARVIGAYDVPALWSRADDPEQSRAVVAAAERTLTALGADGPAELRARLLATVAVESRSADLSGTGSRRAGQAAREAESLTQRRGVRRHHDPTAGHPRRRKGGRGPGRLPRSAAERPAGYWPAWSSAAWRTAFFTTCCSS
ncbi:hypothetical protein ACUJ8M_39785, partial [Streptomyces sp. EWL5.16]